MLKDVQLGCKKCGGVVTVEMKPWPDRVDVRVKDGRCAEKFGKIEIQCPKCRKAIAILALEQVR